MCVCVCVCVCACSCKFVSVCVHVTHHHNAIMHSRFSTRLYPIVYAGLFVSCNALPGGEYVHGVGPLKSSLAKTQRSLPTRPAKSHHKTWKTISRKKMKPQVATLILHSVATPLLFIVVALLLSPTYTTMRSFCKVRQVCDETAVPVDSYTAWIGWVE